MPFGFRYLVPGSFGSRVGNLGYANGDTQYATNGGNGAMAPGELEGGLYTWFDANTNNTTWVQMGETSPTPPATGGRIPKKKVAAPWNEYPGYATDENGNRRGGPLGRFNKFAEGVEGSEELAGYTTCYILHRGKYKKLIKQLTADQTGDNEGRTEWVNAKDARPDPKPEAGSYQ
jgi:hypothetical protein